LSCLIVAGHDGCTANAGKEEVVKAMEAVEVKVAAEVVQVVGLVLKGSVLLGTVQQKAATLE
jgi:hypothetical protein